MPKVDYVHIFFVKSSFRIDGVMVMVGMWAIIDSVNLTLNSDCLH